MPFASTEVKLVLIHRLSFFKRPYLKYPWSLKHNHIFKPGSAYTIAMSAQKNEVSSEPYYVVTLGTQLN